MTSNYLYFDVATVGYDLIGVSFDENLKRLYITPSSFNKLDFNKLSIKYRNLYPQIDTVRFIYDERPLFPNQTTFFKRFQLQVFNPKLSDYYSIGWNLDDILPKLSAKNSLGNTLAYNTAKGNVKDIYTRFWKVVDISKLNPKNDNFELQALYKKHFLIKKPKYFERGELEDTEKLIDYVVRRVLAIRDIFLDQVYQNAFNSHAELVEHFALQSITNIGDTSANIATEIITNQNELQMQDSPSISFNYLNKDLLTEVNLPKPVFNFYNTLQGKSIKRSADLKNFYKETESKTINVLLNNDPNQATQTFSLGGAHGYIINNGTQQFENVYAIDASSMYPTLARNLNIYGEVYNEILDKRLEIKNSLPADKTSWDESDYANYNLAKSYKDILNPPTGKSNMLNPKAKLPLDNKIISMRVIGNILIYELAMQCINDLNAQVLFINTDGIKIKTDAGDDTIKELIANFEEEYQLSFEIEKLSRLIIKDSNNILEWQNDALINVTGKIGKGYQGKIPLDGNLDHPIIVDQAITSYFNTYLDWQEKTPSFAKEYFKKFLIKKAVNNNSLDWVLFLNNTEKMTYYLNDRPIARPAMCMFTDEGYKATCKNQDGKEKKITNWTSDTVTVMTPRKKPAPNTDAYLDWCIKTFKQWYTPKASTQLNLNDEPTPTKLEKKQETKSKIKATGTLAKLLG